MDRPPGKLPDGLGENLALLGVNTATHVPTRDFPSMERKIRNDISSQHDSHFTESQRMTSPHSTKTSRLVQRFKDCRRGDPGEGAVNRNENSPRTPGFEYPFENWTAEQLSRESGHGGSATPTQSDVNLISTNSSVGFSEQSSLPLSSLYASTNQYQASSSSRSVLPHSTIRSSTVISTQSTECSMASSLPGSSSPPIF